MTSEFQSFGKISNIGKIYMSITQKIHGSNAQVYIYKDDSGELQVLTGSRSRWITIDNDNYNFAQFVNDHRQEFIDLLGEGRHFGEWAGPGINSGEGLTEKRLILFNWRRWQGKQLPAQTTVVPLLYKGCLSLDAVSGVMDNLMDNLKTNGSQLVPGYMKPEGCVIEIDGQFYKNVFDAEEVRWTEKTKTLSDKISVDITYLLQPLRLEKLLSRDEAYIREYPESLGRICKDYMDDLIAEDQIKFANEDEFKLQRKALGRELYSFVKSIVLANYR